MHAGRRRPNKGQTKGKMFLFNTFTQKLMKFKGVLGRNGGRGQRDSFIRVIVNLRNMDNFKFI